MRTMTGALAALSLAMAGLTMATTAARAGDIRTADGEYRHGDVLLQGYWAWDAERVAAGKLPVVLVVHQWMGLGDYEKRRARELAELGYLAFAVDMYGKDTRPANRQEAGAFAGRYRADRGLMRARAAAALDFVRQDPRADAGRVAIMGYCFGGGVALELARGGADLRGAISFHGSLNTPNPADAKAVRCPLLVLHGAADTAVSEEEVRAFMKEMTDAGVDWQLVHYAKAVHGFTEAGSDRYDERADHRSWDLMQRFLSEVMAK